MRISVFLLVLFTAACSSGPKPAPSPRINEIQLIGTHNSYRPGLGPSEMSLLRKTDPRQADNWEYKHLPLDQQLDLGVRQFEFDIFVDTEGGRFANPLGPRRVAQAGLPADPPFDPNGALKQPGFKVMHVQDLDYRSSCQPFTNCLSMLREWSKRNPRHLPIFVLVENKDSKPKGEGYVTPEPVTMEALNALDAEIRSIFPPEELITPDDVRGPFQSLEQAVLKRGWPTVDRARGKFIFLLDQERFTPMYTAGRSMLEGRVLFTNGLPGTPDAAFIKLNNPLTDGEEILKLVKEGYLVRTMTDNGVAGVRANDTTRRDAAFANGAHLLSTDYPFTYKHPESGYSVGFESGIARCNPVSAKPGCSAEQLTEGPAPAEAQ